MTIQIPQQLRAEPTNCISPMCRGTASKKQHTPATSSVIESCVAATKQRSICRSPNKSDNARSQHHKRVKLMAHFRNACIFILVLSSPRENLLSASNHEAPSCYTKWGKLSLISIILSVPCIHENLTGRSTCRSEFNAKSQSNCTA